jgi:transcriptional regulator with XRE-family HTH domain
MLADTTSTREQIVASLADKEYRDLLVQESINQGIAFQIRANRIMRGWTQGELGGQAGRAQSEISRLEDPDYEGYTLKTLTCLASAFDVALSVQFVPFSELVDNMSHRTSRSLTAPSFSDDEGLRPRTGPELSIQTTFFDAFNTQTSSVSNVVSLPDYRAKAVAADKFESMPHSGEDDYSWQTTAWRA